MAQPKKKSLFAQRMLAQRETENPSPATPIPAEQLQESFGKISRPLTLFYVKLLKLAHMEDYKRVYFSTIHSQTKFSRFLLLQEAKAMSFPVRMPIVSIKTTYSNCLECLKKRYKPKEINCYLPSTLILWLSWGTGGSRKIRKKKWIPPSVLGRYNNHVQTFPPTKSHVESLIHLLHDNTCIVWCINLFQASFCRTCK